jgi:hypothetical protein
MMHPIKVRVLWGKHRYHLYQPPSDIVDIEMCC